MFIGNYFKKQKIMALEDNARKFQSNGQYAEAAENYAQVASAYVADNPLIYASYCHKAFNLWLRAGDEEKAMEQARATFRVLDDTGWLNRSMEKVLDLKLMIDEFRAAGYANKADTFADELNKKLAEFGLMLRPTKTTHHPSLCPACGAQLPRAESGEEVQCSFCGYIISSN